MATDAKEEPKNRKQLLCRQDKDKWKNAVDEKIDYILNNEEEEEEGSEKSRSIFQGGNKWKVITWTIK